MADLTAHHVGITVTDLDRAVAFYRDALGLSLIDRFTVSGEAFSEAVEVENATGAFAHFDAGSVRIELIEYEPVGEDRTGGKINDPGAKHVGLAVDDVDATVAELPEDVERLSEPQTTETGTRIAFIRDPDGTLIEFLDA